jgi:aspartate aminotransferase-like enzyme
LLLSNGEFGQRLVDQAKRFNLKFDLLEFPWGQPLDIQAVRERLAKPAAGAPRIGWLWTVHCETSTGVLNDLEQLATVCAEFNVKLCLDCISSVGTVPMDLSRVYLASCASGKGLRAYPGVSMVFYHHDVAYESQRLPRYLDLSHYAAQEGAPFTFSSNLLHALHAAVKRVPWNERFAELITLSGWLRAKLIEIGFELIGDSAKTSPAVVTIALPAELNSVKIGGLAQESGYLLSYNSEYLRRRNWIQICLMGECAQEKLVSLLNCLNRVCFKRRPARALATESANVPTSAAQATQPAKSFEVATPAGDIAPGSPVAGS